MISIRKAALRDIPSVVGLWKGLMNDHDGIVLKRNKKLITYVPKKRNAADIWQVFIKRQLKSRKGAIFLAEVDDVIVGYILVLIKDEIPVFKLEKLGYISDLYVRKKFRGQSVSSKLKDEALSWLKRKGLKHVSIGLYVGNELAHSVYRKWGFFDYKLEMRRTI